MDISLSPTRWAEKIENIFEKLDEQVNIRESYEHYISKAGYEIQSVATELQDIYINMIKG